MHDSMHRTFVTFVLLAGTYVGHVTRMAPGSSGEQDTHLEQNVNL